MSELAAVFVNLHHLSLFYSTAIFNNDTAAALLKEK
jgi:hypothetical protein